MKGNTNGQPKPNVKYFPVPDFSKKSVIATSNWNTQRTISETGFLKVYIDCYNNSAPTLLVNDVATVSHGWCDGTADFPPFPIYKGDKIKGKDGSTPEHFEIAFMPIRWVEIPIDSLGGGRLT